MFVTLKVSALYCYPIKSMGEIALLSAKIDRFGIHHDRRWMLVDDKGKFITQRQRIDMVRFKVSQNADGYTLRYQHDTQGDSILLTPEDFLNNGTADVVVWRDQCSAQVASDHINQWISERLNRSCRLVFMADTTRRMVDETYAKNQETVSFADGFPLLLTTDASLAHFNQHLSDAVEMLRFRPNVVISGSEPWDEDQWQAIRIGELEFAVSKPCSRCVIPTINRTTTEKEPEVFKALKQYRARNGEVFFGQNLLPQGVGEIHVGDEVELLK